jgi:pimeloyl-ACP methyl ester carboxylesterase
MKTDQVHVGDITMRWEEDGDGFPAIFLHGIPTSPRLWRHVLPLVQGGRCLAWEMVGYGDSIPEGRGRPIGVRQQADYLLRWMRHIGLERAVLVGHDLGGGVAQIVATLRPPICAGLVLTNSIGYDAWPIPEVRSLRAMGGILRKAPNGMVKPLFALILARGHDDKKRAVESHLQHWTSYGREPAAEEFVRQARSLNNRDTMEIADRLQSTRIPSRVVWGAADPFLPVRYGERLATDLGTHLQRIEGGKHFTPEDHPDIVAGAVNDVLREVTGERAA